MADTPDLDARARHLYDQLQAILRDQAPVLQRYYESLIEAGFEKDQAMAMVLVAEWRMMRGTEEFWDA